MFELIRSYWDQLLLFMPLLFVAIVIFIVFWFASLGLKNLIDRGGKRAKLNKEVRELVADLARLVVLAVGVITALGTIGIDVTAMVASIGLTGFALGFALQDIVSNVLAGILLLTYQPFRAGNVIMVAGHKGRVTEIDLRYTTLIEEGHRVLVPNSKLFQESIIVYDGDGRPKPTTLTGNTTG
jgi:small conductance mechanosensitive channel